MRAILTNFGSSGDVEPFFALGIELQRHGHRPLMALSPYYAERAAQLGLEFFPIGPDLQAEQNAINIALITNPAIARDTEALQKLFAPLIETLPRMFNDLSRACRDADLLVSGVTLPTARAVHEITEIPFVAVHTMCPGRSRAPSVTFQTLAPIINPFRQQIGLPPLIVTAQVAGAPWPATDSPLLTLYAISPIAVPRPAGWPPHYHLTGYFFLDSEGWRPDPALEDFMTAGEPPVVLGFGSMAHEDPQKLTELLLDAVRQAGCRAIIQQGWSGLGRRDVPEHVRVIGFAPHSWLFPRAACVVHHAATGTTAAAFRAGVPSVCVPHAYEHPLNAEIAHELGVAGPPIFYSQLSATRLADAIRHTLATPRYAQAAAELGERIRAEQGVRAARIMIEQLVDTLGPRTPQPADASSEQAAARRARSDRRAQFQQLQRQKKSASQE